MIKKLLSLTTCLTLLFTQATKATVWYVNLNATGTNNGTSWTNAFTSLQSGISATNPGDSIWVANGVYKPIIVATPTPANRDVSFTIPTGVLAFGGFVGTETSIGQRNLAPGYLTILSGDIGIAGNNTDNSYHVVRMNTVSSQTRLDGFKVINGRSTGSTLSSTDGAGLYNTNGSPTIANCQFSYNSGTNSAALKHVSGGNIVIKNCIFDYNNATSYGGAVGINNGTATISDCKFNQNQADNGGALYLFSGVTTVDRCDISGNTAGTYGGAIYEGNASASYWYNTLIVGNQSVEDCGTSMAPLSNTNPHKWINCTIAHNKATTTNNIDYVITLNSLTEVKNCIIWGNITGSGDQFYANGGPVDNNLVQGGIPVGTSTNTFTFQPAFLSPALAASAPFNASGYDYRVDVMSRAVDTGVTAPISPLYNLDIAGNARTWGGKPDLGCYENQYCPLTPVINASGSTTFCNGQTVTLTATGGTRFRWANGDTTAARTVNTTGDYPVIVATAAGCRGIATKTVTVNAPTVNISGATSFCAGSSTTLTASGNAVSYLWNTSATTPSITVTTGGTYSVTGTDAAGCTKMTVVVVNQNPLPLPVIVTAGAALKTSIVFAAYEWQLNGSPIAGATSQNYTPTANGTYTVKVTNTVGCVNTSAPFVVTNVGVSGVSNADDLIIYPNPATSQVVISSREVVQKAHITICDLAGRVVIAADISGKDLPYSINTNALSNGVYLMRFESAGRIQRTKLEVQH